MISCIGVVGGNPDLTPSVALLDDVFFNLFLMKVNCTRVLRVVNLI